MKEKKLLKIILLILTITVIVIMGYFIYKISNEKARAEEEVTNLNKEISTLENTTSQLQEKINTISDTINSNVSTNSTTNNTTNNTITSTTSNTNRKSTELVLDKEYKNTDYGITFSYPSSFSNHENSLKDDSVESFTDSNNNQIVIVRNSNSTIDDEINNIKTLTTPDGSIFNTNIKENGYITLNSGTTGYKMEMTSDGKDNIKFLTQKDNNVFSFSFTIESDKNQYTEIFDKIISSISVK